MILLVSCNDTLGNTKAPEGRKTIGGGVNPRKVEQEKRVPKVRQTISMASVVPPALFLSHRQSPGVTPPSVFCQPSGLIILYHVYVSRNINTKENNPKIFKDIRMKKKVREGLSYLRHSYYFPCPHPGANIPVNNLTPPYNHQNYSNYSYFFPPHKILSSSNCQRKTGTILSLEQRKHFPISLNYT
jgi:hypothetical protein